MKTAHMMTRVLAIVTVSLALAACGSDPGTTLGNSSTVADTSNNISKIIPLNQDENPPTVIDNSEIVSNIDTAPADKSTAKTVEAVVAIVPKVTVTSSPTAATHAGVFYATPVVIKVVDQSNKPIVGVTPTVKVNDNGWVVNSVKTTDSTGSISYNWAPGTSTSPTATFTYGSSSATVTGKTTPWTAHPNGLANIEVSTNATAATGYQRDVTPMTFPDGTFYAVLSWNGGYAGIQKGGTTYDRQLQFSLWNIAGKPATSVVNAYNSKCTSFAGEGQGTACANTYPWVPGNVYRFTMTKVSGTNASGAYSDVTVTFLDVTKNISRPIAVIRQYGTPAFNYVSSFVEDFKMTSPDCYGIADRVAIFSSAKFLVGSTWNTIPKNSYQNWYPTQYCAMNTYETVPTGVKMEMGSSYRAKTTSYVFAIQ